MSRITNDTSAIEQAFSFALVNVFSGILLLVWVAYNMLTASLPFALLSLVVAPVMFIATLYFSSRRAKPSAPARKEIGNVNAELQESIAAVREVQAFNRADENIEQFKEVNAANRDANVRAVAYTSALAPTLEALSYVALASSRRRADGICSRGQPSSARPSPLAWSSPSSPTSSASTSPSSRSPSCGRTSRTPSPARNASSAFSTRSPPWQQAQCKPDAADPGTASNSTRRPIPTKTACLC
jgi:hypothetical protein